MYFLTAACEADSERTIAPPTGDKLFTSMPSGYTGVDFINQLEYDRDFNIYTYRNFYNGGGVGLGDFNRDGLTDIYLTANMKPNRLYINRGDFKFEEVAEQAGVRGERAWSTGVSVADVNGDGWLDIYVCNSGDVEGDNKQNELYINNGDLTFSEKAEDYGLADRGYSTHAAFFDYDKDGDLDLYLLNNSYQAIGSFNLRKNIRPGRDSVGGDKLFRNDGNRFTDVSREANIYGSVIGFGLGVTVGDINGDSWPDIYVSNDFFERDYIYINNGDGTFTESLEDMMRSISAASMGADMADINNDSRPEIFVTDMLPEPDDRLKTKTTFDSWDRYQYGVANGYYHQFIRNMLHLNNGDDTFSEIGRLAGVEATDWSWGALIMDMNNDGRKDIFVANGIYQDLTDQDYIQFISHEETMRSIISKNGVDYKRLIDSIPSERIPNYAFKNMGNLDFENRAAEWGLDFPSHSNGSAYGDLDNDGDLDLVVNNVNMEAFLYRSEARQLLPDNHYLQFELTGEGANTQALGTKITIRHQGQSYFLEHMPMRGFQSTVDYRPHIGLGGIAVVDSLIVEWPNGEYTVMTGVETDQTLALSQSEAKPQKPAMLVAGVRADPLFREVSDRYDLPYRHDENRYVDFDRERLIYHMLSTQGPHLAKADVNADGLEDIFLGGAKDQAGKMLIQRPGGRFTATNESVFEKDALSEDTDCLFFDADGDGDPDLYVASGGNEFPGSSTALNDRLYINDGRGNFTRSEQTLPSFQFESSSCVQAADFDGDGDQDLFVGVRLRPWLYGVPPRAYLLENDGRGQFSDITEEMAPSFLDMGMVTDAYWTDYDQDGDLDLIVLGEWMPIRVFRNEEGRFSEVTEAAGLAGTNGWWNCLRAGDFNADGYTDFVLGNHGLNSRFRASKDKPLTAYINDFDKNGRVEQIISGYNMDDSYPMVLRHDLVMQMPSLKKKYLKYENYKNQTVEDIFEPRQLEGSVVLNAYQMETSVMMNQGDGTFAVQSLPIEAQLSPVYGLLVKDFDGDGHADILLGGNFHDAKPEVGRYDASYGTFLRGDGKGGFVAVPNRISGLQFEGQVRELELLRLGGKNRILVVRNDEPLQIYEY